MNLKTSLFSKSIYKTDIKRFYIASILYTVALFFIQLFQYFINKPRYINHIVQDKYLNTTFANAGYFAHIVGLGFGAILALMLFSYLNNTASVSFYHALPCKRKTLYISKIATGLTLLTLPVVLITIISLFTYMSGNVYMGIKLYHIFVWAYLQLMYSILAFSVVSFVALITGNTLSLIYITAVCVFSPFIMLAFIDNLLKRCVYGYAGEFLEESIEWLYILPKGMLTTKCLIYIILAIVLFISTYFIYKVRKLEANGEALVFKPLKTVFNYVLGGLFGIMGYWYFGNFFPASPLFLLPFGIVGVIIANMLNKKAVTLKGFLKPSVIFSICILILFSVIKYDLTGFERRIPSDDEIKSVTASFRNGYFRVMAYTNSGIPMYCKDENKRYEITDKDEFIKATKYHKHKIENRISNDENFNIITITYTLENGKTLTRKYKFDYFNDEAMVTDLIMSDQLKAERYPFYNLEGIEVTRLQVNDILGKLEITPDDDTFDKLLNAVNEDIKNLPYSEDATLFNQATEPYLSMMVFYTFPGVDSEGKEIKNYQAYTTQRRISISDGFTNTLKVLDEIGFTDTILKAADIQKIGLVRQNRYGQQDFKITKDIPFKDYFVEKVTTDPDEINAIYTYMRSSYKPIYEKYQETWVTIHIELKNTEVYSFDVPLYPDASKLFKELSQ